MAVTEIDTGVSVSPEKSHCGVGLIIQDDNVHFHGGSTASWRGWTRLATITVWFSRSAPGGKNPRDEFVKLATLA